MRVDLIEFVHMVNDRVFTIPKGTRLRQRHVDAGGTPCKQWDEGATAVDDLLPQDVQVELHFDLGRVNRCLSKALNSRGGNARVGAVVISVLRGKR
jgi:hypothetical protein